MTMTAASPSTRNPVHDHDEHFDPVASRMGMWLFLLNEVIFFSGLFLLFVIYMFQYADEFSQASSQLNLLLGSINTFILLISSMTMGFSLTALRAKRLDRARQLLLMTIFLAFVFLVIKAFEWGPKIAHGIYPQSPDLIIDALATGSAFDHGNVVFFGLYYLLTGLHALHVIVGIVFMAFMYYAISGKEVSPKSFAHFENCGLYWDLVHLVWVFLFPLFYLIFVLK